MGVGLTAYRDGEDLGKEQAGVGPQAPDDFAMMCEDSDRFCQNHLELATKAALERKRQMERRLAFVQAIWNDAERFDVVVASGRYLKLCNLTEWISEEDERAWARVKDGILAAMRA